jgi:hypothetical protein
MTAYERVNLVGERQKEVRFFIISSTYLKAKELERERKRKKKRTLNPTFLYHTSLWGQRTLEERNLSLPGNHCVWLEQESIFYEWNKKLLFIFVGSTGQVYFHTQMNAQTNRLLRATYPIVQTMMQRAVDVRREVKRRECMMLVQLKRELNNAQNEASLFVLFPHFFFPFLSLNF